MTDIEDLAEIRSRGLYRRLRVVSGPQGPRVLLDGKPSRLCSNNYLGLADHPGVREAAAEAAMRYGAGAGASRLISGNMTIHRRLEERLAEFHGAEACLLGSGTSRTSARPLAREGDVVFSDALNHASIVDGCRLARAGTFVYEHSARRSARAGAAAGRRPRRPDRHRRPLLDGRGRGPAEEIVELASRYARVMIDEAHGIGTIGPGGRGTVAAAGLEDEVDVLVGTLGRIARPAGAYVCCDKQLAVPRQFGANADFQHRAAPPRSPRRVRPSSSCASSRAASTSSSATPTPSATSSSFRASPPSRARRSCRW